MITATAPARVGILGNPSDGYGGRTLSLAVSAFDATVELEPAPRLVIIQHEADEPVWSSVADLTDRVERHGYGTGPQLLAATIKTFADVAQSVEFPGFPGQAFRLRYQTNIPRQVGLGGSSALVVATLKALCELTGLEVPDHVLPSVALRVETEQLGITAGLQDRVVQTMGGLVSMDFGAMTTDARFGVTHGAYRAVDPSSLPPLFLAYREQSAEPSGNYHRVLRRRFDQGDGEVREGLRSLAALVVEGEAALRWSNPTQFAELIGRNMGIRRSLAPVSETQLELVEVAASLDVPTTFAGSGGAVVGVYEDTHQLDRLTAAMAAAQAVTVPLTAG